MRRTLLLAAVAATLSLTSGGADAAVRYCYNNGGGCVYSSGGYWCWWERGANGNSFEYCVGATGVRQCTDNFPEPRECRYIGAGPITTTAPSAS